MADTVTWINFLTTRAGQTVSAWERAVFARLNRSVQGLRAVQIGAAAIDAFEQSSISHRILIEDKALRLEENDLRHLVLASPHALPIESESIDYVVLPHALDKNNIDTKALLDEVMRILAPNGIVATTFFNANGSWCWLEKFFLSTPLPSDARAISVASARTDLSLAGFSIEGGHFGVYGVGRQTSVPHALLPTWMDKAGDRWWPTMGNVAFLYARKRVNSMTLVGKSAFRKVRLPMGSSVLAHKQAEADQS